MLETILDFFKSETDTDLSGLFAPKISYNSPEFGAASGRVSAKRQLTKLRHDINDVAESVELVSNLGIDGYETMELVFAMKDTEDYPRWPMAIAADVAEDGLLSGLRLYYGSEPFVGMHRMRSAIFGSKNESAVPAYITAYRKALAGGKVDSMLRLFDADAVAQAANGTVFGGDSDLTLADFFGFAFQPGKITVSFPKVSTFDSDTDGNETSVAEYTCSAWGSKIAPQPGIEFWEVNDNGLITALRMYDDIAVPNPTSSSSKSFLSDDLDEEEWVGDEETVS